MDPTKLSTIVSLLIALSIASERLVEIVKGFLPWLDQQKSNPTEEGFRKAVLQALAVGAGIFTVWIAPTNAGIPADFMGKLALGLLASGGSGFWNSILTYVTKAKDIKEAQAAQLTKPGA
jgi:hypothetical protein